MGGSEGNGTCSHRQVSTRAVLRRVAQTEFEESVAWYERQRPGLGALFAEEIERALAQVELSPLAFPVVHRDLRGARVHRFPFSVVYRAEPKRILVVAVFHAKRNPAHWRGRV